VQTSEPIRPEEPVTRRLLAIKVTLYEESE